MPSMGPGEKLGPNCCSLVTLGCGGGHRPRLGQLCGLGPTPLPPRCQRACFSQHPPSWNMHGLKTSCYCAIISNMSPHMSHGPFEHPTFLHFPLY